MARITYGPWATIVSSDDAKSDSTEMEEVWKRCQKCTGTGILVIEDWRGKIEYKKCRDCDGKGQVLVDVVVK